MFSLISNTFDMITRQLVSTRKLLRYISFPRKLSGFFSLVDLRPPALIGFKNCLSAPHLQRASLWKTNVKREVNSEIVRWIFEPASLLSTAPGLDVPEKLLDDCLFTFFSLKENIPELSESQLVSSCESAFLRATWLKAEMAAVLSGFAEMFFRAMLACSLRSLLSSEEEMLLY